MNEAIILTTLKIFEEKLIELMGLEEYQKFSKKIAMDAWRAEIACMPEGDFKKFCEDNFDYITNDDNFGGDPFNIFPTGGNNDNI